MKKIITLRGKDALVEFDYERLVPASFWYPSEGGYEICEVSWDEDGRLLTEEEIQLFSDEIINQLEELRYAYYLL